MTNVLMKRISLLSNYINMLTHCKVTSVASVTLRFMGV